MNYANIKYFDIADGEGVRTSLFVSGCRRGCKNCFNSVAWDFAAGEPFDRAVEDKIIESLDHPFIDGLTILGGEPMEPENQAGLVDFIERVRAAYPAGSGKTIWCFTGDVLEELMPGGRHHTEVTDRILACLDMLVDGPFVQDLYDISLRFRGSTPGVKPCNKTSAAESKISGRMEPSLSAWVSSMSTRWSSRSPAASS